MACIAAIAIPNLLRSRMQANERVAINNVQSIANAQKAFHDANGRYAETFGELVNANLLPGNWAEPKQGYRFELVGGKDTFTLKAEPVTPGRTGNRRFYRDQSGIIRCNATGTADVTSSPLGEAP
jgi:type II secretory pathway pseudopilin PulG